MPSSMLYTLSLPIHFQRRSESTNSSSETKDMSQISTLTRAHIPIFSARKRKRFVMEEQGKRLSETRSTRFSRISDLRRMVSSKICSFVADGLLSNEQAMVAARHFDAKHFGIEVEMWLGFKDAKKVDYIKSLCRKACTKKSKEEITDDQNKLAERLELIPEELAAKILNKLGALEIFPTASLVCHFWWKICKSPLTWRTIDLTNHPHYPDSKLEKFCLHAIQQSCGNLEDIRIEDFCTDEILKSIADSGSSLQRMQLLDNGEISDKQLRETVKKLPLLEEFEISFSRVSKGTLELIGKCCPNLKILKFNKREFKGFKNDDEAFAIAKTMPQLRHLQLLGNRLTNEGLVAILDGCPHLESLYLRVCSNVVLTGSLKERCCKQIKHLRFPDDLSEVSIYVDEGCGCGCDNDHQGSVAAYEDEDLEYFLANYFDLL